MKRHIIHTQHHSTQHHFTQHHSTQRSPQPKRLKYANVAMTLGTLTALTVLSAPIAIAQSIATSQSTATDQSTAIAQSIATSQSTATDQSTAIAQSTPQPSGEPAIHSATSTQTSTQTLQQQINQRMSALKQKSDRWIEIRLDTQRLVAWQGNKPVYAIVISTGKDEAPTPAGIFTIQSKHEVTRMQGTGYDVPDVPFAMFYDGHYAIHGAYWHQRFGTPVSHGCTNVAVNHAEWLFEWASAGTPVIVH
jgi:lipoprotein-anchoring transpeptidase ErfK/SrfK